MNRRRLLYLGTALALIGAILAAWLLFANRDADFHVIGPKTRGVRLNLALLDSKIDVADFHACTTVGQVLKLLNQKLAEEPKQIDDVVFVFGHDFTLDRDAFAMNLNESPLHFAAESRPVAVKHFLREVIGQTEATDVQFIVRAHSISITTLPTLRQERTNFLDNTSVFDRLRQTWKDLTGDIEEDPMGITIF
jgi:hypothetical protein